MNARSAQALMTLIGGLLSVQEFLESGTFRDVEPTQDLLDRQPAHAILDWQPARAILGRQFLHQLQGQVATEVPKGVRHIDTHFTVALIDLVQDRHMVGLAPASKLSWPDL